MDQYHGGSNSLGSLDSSYGDPPPPPPPPRKSRNSNNTIQRRPAGSGGPEYVQSRSTGTTVTRDRARKRSNDPPDENSFDDSYSSRPGSSYGKSAKSYVNDASSVGSQSTFSHNSGAPPPPPPPGQPPNKANRSSTRGGVAHSSSRDSRGPTPVAGHSTRRKREDLGRILENNEGQNDYERMDDNSTANDSRSFFDEPQDRRRNVRGAKKTRQEGDDRSAASSALSNLIDESRRKHEQMKQGQGDVSHKSGISADDVSRDSRLERGRTTHSLVSKSEDTEVLQFGNMPVSKSRDSTGSKESVAARRRRKAQAAAVSGANSVGEVLAPTTLSSVRSAEPQKKEEKIQNNFGTNARTGTEKDNSAEADGAKSDDDPPLELYSESDSDDSYGENDAVVKKKKKKKGLGFFKVKNLIRMGGVS